MSGSVQDVFTAAYRIRAWGSEETVSGPGSIRARTDVFLPDLLALLKRLRVLVLLDAPCGDFNWAAPLADTVEHYIGVDVVPDLIADLTRIHSGPNRRFDCLDLTNDDLPQADLLFCRDCLVHLSHRHVAQAIQNIRRGGARYLLTTTFTGDRINRDVFTGGWRPINLERAPFNFPPPEALIDEKCDQADGRFRDKHLGLWSVDALPDLSDLA